MINLEQLKAMIASGEGGRLLVIRWASAPRDEYTTAYRIIQDIDYGFYTVAQFEQSATVEAVKL